MRNKFAKVSDPNEFATCAGDKYHITYSTKVMSDGKLVLEVNGKEDIQSMINSHRDETDMSFIIQRLAMGDTSVLNKKAAMYGDFTEMPKTYAESLQLVMDAEKHFYEMPLEVRNKFGNDFRQWFATAGASDWFSKMGIEKSVEEPNDKEIEEGSAE